MTLGGAAFVYWLVYQIPPSPFTQEHTILIKDFTIHYSVQGQGPPVLLIHGLGASLHCWTELAPLLAAKHKVIALDLPGFGNSSKLTNHKYGLDEQADRIAAFLDALQIDECFLVGHS